MFDLTVLCPEIEDYLRWLSERERLKSPDLFPLEFRFSRHNQLYDTSFDPRGTDDPRLTSTIEIEVFYGREFWKEEYIDHAEFFIYREEVLGWSTTLLRENVREGDHRVFAVNQFGPEFSRDFKLLPLPGTSPRLRAR